MTATCACVCVQYASIENQGEKFMTLEDFILKYIGLLTDTEYNEDSLKLLANVVDTTKDGYVVTAISQPVYCDCEHNSYLNGNSVCLILLSLSDIVVLCNWSELLLWDVKIRYIIYCLHSRIPLAAYIENIGVHRHL